MTDLQGHHLDGDWVDTRAELTVGTGDGVGGGDFAFSFNVLPGNVIDMADTAVTTDDVQFIESLLVNGIGPSVGHPAYDPAVDVNGDGLLNEADLNWVTLSLGAKLVVQAAVGGPIVCASGAWCSSSRHIMVSREAR